MNKLQADILAMGVLIASQLIISIFFFVVGLKIGKVALATMLDHIDERILTITNQMYEKIDEKIQATIDEISGVFGEVFEKPNVKKAFSIIGSQGGQATADRALTNQIATDILSGSKFAGLKLAAEAVGIDLEGYIESHGAVNTINSINSLGSMIPGFDLGSLLQGGMDLSVGPEANGSRPRIPGG